MSEQGLTKVRKTKVHKVVVEQVDARSMRRIREAWGMHHAPRLRKDAIRRWLTNEPYADLVTLAPFLRVPQLRNALEILGWETDRMRRDDLVSALVYTTGVEIIERWPDSEDAEFFSSFLPEDDAESIPLDDDSDLPLPCEVVLRRALDGRDFDPEMPLDQVLRHIRSWTPKGLETMVENAARQAERLDEPMCEWFLLKEYQKHRSVKI